MLFNDNGELPEPMLYFVFGDIELFCKEIDDFKGAYDFSNNKEFKMSYDDFLKLLLQDKIELIKRNDI